MLELLGVQILVRSEPQVLLHLRTECPPLFSSEVNLCLQTRDLTWALFIVTAASWRFFAAEKLRESSYIWNPDLPRPGAAKTGGKSHLHPKSHISAHLTKTLFSTKWNSWPAVFFKTKFCNFSLIPHSSPGSEWVLCSRLCRAVFGLKVLRFYSAGPAVFDWL